MCENGDSSAGSYGFDGLLRVDVGDKCGQTVQDIPECLVLALSIAVLDHQVGDMGLSRIVPGKQVLPLLLGKSNPHLGGKEIESGLQLLYSQIVGFGNELGHGAGICVIAVAEDMVLALLVPA